MSKKYRVWYRDFQMGYIDVEADDKESAHKKADDILYDKRGNLDAYSPDLEGFEYTATKELTGDALCDSMVDC